MFKNRKPPATRRNNNSTTLFANSNKLSNFLLTFLIGISTGITITLLIIIFSNYSKLTSKINFANINILSKKSNSTSAPTKQDKLLITKNNFNSNNLSNNYDFYNLLPNNIEAPINNDSTNKASAPDNFNINTNNNANHTLATTNKYYIEAGSFKTMIEADGLKAQLILHGFEATIKNLNPINNNNDIEHKVILGPFDSQSSAILKKEQLIAAGFNSIIIN